MSPLAPVLVQASGAVARVAAGRSLAAELAQEDGATRAALLDVTHGTLRRFGRVQAIERALSRKAGTEPAVRALVWCALYALESQRYAPYTVVDQAVEACGRLGKPRAKGYVNALLRAWLRERDSVGARIAAEPEARWQHPRWWIDAVRAAYPAQWEAILQAGNETPPLGLRVNRRRSEPEAYAARLLDAGLAATRVEGDALLLDRPVAVERLPGFAQGEVSVQDVGAQRAAALLELRDGQRVLDACAAPGGKSAHVLERAQVALTALDVDAERCALVERNLERLGLRATVKAADCTAVEGWWDGQAFDRVLADVPCSASGIARRHPDIKWLRRAADVDAYAARQGKILDALWRVLTPGGKLLYATCSVFPRENEAVVAAFVGRSGAGRAPLADGRPAQSLPGPGHDGFFYALLEKRT